MSRGGEGGEERGAGRRTERASLTTYPEVYNVKIIQRRVL
jgi:hypothetical protein